MKIPSDCKVSVSLVDHAANRRPKAFYVIDVKCGDLVAKRYVLAHPLLLRIRLSMGLRKSLRMIRKLAKFHQNKNI
jgi:hypothetical protein